MTTPEHVTTPTLRPSPRPGGRLRSTLAVTLLALTAFAVFTVARPADAADDIDLLRENGGNPFVMILLDTSASMALLPPDNSDSNRYFGDLAAANGEPQLSIRASSLAVQSQSEQAQGSLPFRSRQRSRACASCTRSSSKYSSQ